MRRELFWTHYKVLLRVEKPEACVWYMHEAADQNWAARALERQINSLVTFVTSDEKCRGELEFKFKPGFNFRDYIVNFLWKC